MLRELSRTEGSRPTSGTVWSESMTRCATSVLNSRVNFLLVTVIRTSFQPPHRGDMLGVYFFWGTSAWVKGVNATFSESLLMK